MTFSAPKGTYDILPLGLKPDEMWKHSDLWHHIEQTAFELSTYYGFREIRTPLFERTEIFQRSVGESSDIVSKEMYTFFDKGDRSMTLRPEMTASVMRACIENQLYLQSHLIKLYYMGPMFRYDRPQAGRYRQFSQFGAEVIGNDSPEQDAEVIDFLYSLYSKLGLKTLTLHINSVGDASCREAFKNELKAFLLPHKESLSKDSQVRLENNPLRILDSKDASDQALLQGAPSLSDYLNEECREHLQIVCKLLQQLKIPYKLNSKLVRGLDYYNKTVFEITSGELGAQNTIGAGGRYDGLLKTMGGPDLPAVGFATGIERIIQTLLHQEVPFPHFKAPTLYLIALGEIAKEYCFNLLKTLRMHQIPVEMDFNSKKLKDALRLADQLNVRFTLIIGDRELQEDRAELKEMATRLSKQISLSQLALEPENVL